MSGGPEGGSLVDLALARVSINEALVIESGATLNAGARLPGSRVPCQSSLADSTMNFPTPGGATSTVYIFGNTTPLPVRAQTRRSSAPATIAMAVQRRNM